MHAVGIDLAWSPNNATGIAVAVRTKAGWKLETADTVRSNDDILAFLEAAVGKEPAILAIDAPLVVPHHQTTRVGDRAIASVFGPMKAAVYPATKNRLGSYGGRRIWDLVKDLEAAGYRHDCHMEPRVEARQFFETYPHAATVALFHLERILSYKAKQDRPYAERWRAFRRLEAYLRSLGAFEPRLRGVDKHLEPQVSRLKGKALKGYEDRLDGILCAYIAAYYWTWGTERCAIFGSLEGGYIVTPMSPEVARRIPDGSSVVMYTGKRGLS